MRTGPSTGCDTNRLRRRQPVAAWRMLGWRILAWHVLSGWHRAQVWWQTSGLAPVRAWRSALARHPALRFVQIIPVALVLWGLDDAASLRAGAAVDGMRHAVDVNVVSLQIGGGFVRVTNDWLFTHHAAALAATWYYILLQGAITGVIGALLLWRQVPRFGLYRNSLIAITAVGLVAFWFYPVAPPRLLPGYHDVIASALPAFANSVEPAGSATYAALPSLHVAWAFWTAFALMALVRRPLLRAVVWLYPAATILDVTATANHYLLDVVTAVGLLLLGYLLAMAPSMARALLARRRRAAAGVHGAVLVCAIPAPDAAHANADGSRRR